MTTEQMIANLKEANKILRTEEVDVPYEIRAGFGIQQGSASELVKELTPKLWASVSPSKLFGISASGDQEVIGKVIETVTSEDDGLHINVEVWNGIADQIEPSFGVDREFGVNQYRLMVNEVTNLCKDFDIEFKPPEFASGHCYNREQTADFVRTAIRAVVGDQLLIQSLKSAILGHVLEKEVAETVAVVITNLHETEQPATSLIFSRFRNHEFDNKFEVKEESVLSLFKAVK